MLLDKRFRLDGHTRAAQGIRMFALSFSQVALSHRDIIEFLFPNID